MKHLTRLFILLCLLVGQYASACPTHLGQLLLSDDKPFFKRNLKEAEECDALKDLDLSEYDLDEDREDE